MERVRLMCWCRISVSGVHLPAFAAAEGGLFAERGLEVEFVECVRSLDWTLRGFATRVEAVAAGADELREQWPRMATIERRRAISSVIDCAFVSRGQGLGDRVWVYPRGRAPTNLLPSGVRVESYEHPRRRGSDG